MRSRKSSCAAKIFYDTKNLTLARENALARQGPSESVSDALARQGPSESVHTALDRHGSSESVQERVARHRPIGNTDLEKERHTDSERQKENATERNDS